MRRPRISCPYVSMLVFAGFFWCQIAGVADFVNVQACGGALRNLPSAAGREFDLEPLRTNQPASSAFVHGKEVATLPVPAVIAVIVVDADHDFQLRLSPEAGTIGRRQKDSGIEVCQPEVG